ncbi:hypothetical protein [Shewanella spartinae]|uniref:hypothetical protein n=1 Tax=Shewanella spartinae TaxID=2864205 RepID=UPI001C65BF79|nr:hypothetical protein [Shewanella spartinae]QYJ92720.1 hypothetical protein K0I31_13965 [Shewanella spartinae]
MFTLSMKTPFMAAILVTLIAGCATGNTPEAKKENARKETQEALASIYAEHPAAKSAVASSIAHVVCTGSNSYLFALSTGGGGICVLSEGGKNSYYRFATGGVGAGIGWKQVAFVQAFMKPDALQRFKDSGYEGQAQAEASAKYEESGDQMSANQSADLDGVKTYQINLMGAAAQATVQGYKYWPTDFTDDFIEKDK